MRIARLLLVVAVVTLVGCEFKVNTEHSSPDGDSDAGLMGVDESVFIEARARGRHLLNNFTNRREWLPADSRFDTLAAGRFVDSIQAVCSIETMLAGVDREHYYSRLDGPDELTMMFVAPSKCGEYAIIFTYLVEGDSIWFANLNRVQPRSASVRPFFSEN